CSSATAPENATPRKQSGSKKPSGNNESNQGEDLVTKVTLVVTMLVIGAFGAQPARAQDEMVPTGFLNIDAGAQPQRQDITATSSFPLYDETASVTVSQHIRNGAVFDVSGGVRIGRNLAAGVGFSQFGRAGSG